MTSFLLLLIGLVAAMLGGRYLLRKRLLSASSTLPVVIEEEGGLRPAEVAYLSSNGDVSHTLLVLGADLVQRAVKSKLSGQEPQLASYEKKMWVIAKESITDWAQSKADQHLPMNIKKDPIAYVRKVSRLYYFFAHTLRAFVAQTLSDPRHIRKYFRLSAIVSIIADFSSAGYKASFEEQFRADLAKRGLLVPKEARVTCANHQMIVAIVGALGASALALYFVSPTPLALLMIFVAFVGAGILRAVLFVVHLIPLYSDIVDVINHVQRKGFRLHILRFAVKSISIVSFAIIILGFVLLNAMFTGAAYLMFGSPEYQTMIMFAGLLLSYVVAFHLMFDSWKMAIEELPSELGITGLKQVRKQLGQQRPLDAFKEVLATTDYQPSFSQLLALYGIEALLLLA